MTFFRHPLEHIFTIERYLREINKDEDGLKALEEELRREFSGFDEKPVAEKAALMEEARKDPFGYTPIDARNSISYIPYRNMMGLLDMYPISRSNNYEGNIGDCPDCGCVFIWIHGYNNDLDEAKDRFWWVEGAYQKAQEQCKVYGFAWHGDPPDPGIFRCRCKSV